MNPFQLTFTLQQHTPIIHFQHDQAGATLRATELKPKLDRFIMEHLTGQGGANALKAFSQALKERIRNDRGENELNQNFNPVWKRWVIGGGKSEHVALNFKIRISDQDTRPLSRRSFGDVKLITDVLPDKRGVSSNSIGVTITSLDTELLSTIDLLLPRFFLRESFGNRQNKGFGSFFHERHEDWNVVKQDLLNSGVPCYVFEKGISTSGRETRFSNFYPVVSEKWKILKSGINLPIRAGNQTAYTKSMLFRYLCSNGLRWDKRWMKQRLDAMVSRKVLPADLLGNHPPSECRSGNEAEYDGNRYPNRWLDDESAAQAYVFGRAMLGLPEHVEFRAHGGYIYQVIVRNTDGIERFQAPVRFKIFGEKLFAIAENPNAMLGQTFQFEVQVKKKLSGSKPEPIGDPIPIQDREGEWMRLKTPATESEFDLVKFLDAYFPEVGFEKLTANSIDRL